MLTSDFFRGIVEFSKVLLDFLPKESFLAQKAIKDFFRGSGGFRDVFRQSYGFFRGRNGRFRGFMLIPFRESNGSPHCDCADCTVIVEYDVNAMLKLEKLRRFV